MFLFLFLIIDLYFLIPAVIKEIFIVIAELAILTGIPTKETRTEIETHPLTVEARISKCSVQFKSYKFVNLYFLLINSFCFISAVK